MSVSIKGAVKQENNNYFDDIIVSVLLGVEDDRYTHQVTESYENAVAWDKVDYLSDKVLAIENNLKALSLNIKDIDCVESSSAGHLIISTKFCKITI
jgi:hypothetical protein